MNDHHAYLFYADSLTDAGIPEKYKKASIDTTHILTDTLRIDEVRSLIEEAYKSPLEEEKRVFVICVRAIAQEAQNALLKLFEEPPSRTLFYVVVPPNTTLLPTLTSRLSLEKRNEVFAQEESEALWQSFLKASLAERLLLVGEKSKEKDHVWIEHILRGFEKYAHKKKNVRLLRCAVLVRTYQKSPGASLKMLLEEMTLTVEEVG